MKNGGWIMTLHANRAQLRHLRKGTASRDESTCSLETLLGMDKIPLYYHDRPREPIILEIPKEPQ